MKSRSLLLTLLFAVFLSGAASAQALKIAVVDLQKAIQAVPAGKAAKTTLEAKAKKVQTDLDKQQNELKQLKDELEKQAALLQDAVKREKLKTYQAKLLALQEAFVKNQQTLKDEENKLLKPIMEKLGKTVEDIAKEQGYTLVVEKGATLYAASAIDITDTVVSRYK